MKKFLGLTQKSKKSTSPKEEKKSEKNKLDEQTKNDWVSSGTLKDCTRFMFEKQLACDCTILVGQQELATKVSAHKFILIARSPVFRAMLCGPMSEVHDVGPEINAEDCDPVAFREVLRYMYCEEADIDNMNAFGVLYAAKKYMLWDLAKECMSYLSKALDEQNVCDLLILSDFFGETALNLSCQNFVKKHADKVVQTQAFLDVPQYILEQILSYDTLAATEEQLFKAILDWSEKQCESVGIEATPENKRRMIGQKAFSEIRLTAFDRGFFYKVVQPSGVLDKAEEASLVDYYDGINMNPVLPWLVQGQRRDPSDTHLIEIMNSCTHSTKLASTWYKTKLEASQDICITRVDVFDRCRPSNTVHVSVEVMQGDSLIVRGSSRTNHCRKDFDRYSIIPIVISERNIVHKGDFEINVCYRFQGGTYGATPSALAPKKELVCHCGCNTIFKCDPDSSVYISSFEYTFPF